MSDVIQYLLILSHEINQTENGWWCGVGFKINCHTRDPRPVGEVPSVEVFLRVAHIYANFGENHGKLRTARSTSTTGDET